MTLQPSAPDMRWLAALPHRASRELPADDTAPREARHLIARLLPGWSLPHFEVAACLVATELITNAMVATRAVSWATPVPSLRLWLCGGRTCAGPPVLAILTWDAASTRPVRRIAADEDENGRGLVVIEELSARWGFYHPDRYPGKVTWAVIETP